MPLPSVISDLSPIIGTGPAPNSGQPGGGENPSTFDDYLRAYGAFIAQLRAGSGFANSGAFRIPFFDASGAWSSSADFVRDASGNVGIGTSSPQARLNISGTGAVTARVSTTDGSGANLDLSAVSTHVQVGSPNGVPLLFTTSGTERMRIDTSGNVGIGTGSPGARLEAQLNSGGTIMSIATTTQTPVIGGLGQGLRFGWNGAASGPTIRLLHGGSYSEAGLGFSTWSGGTEIERIRIDATGHQINTPGSTTPPTLTVNGQLNITPTSNTNVRISYRGTDGVTRTANITLT